ncbi:MAG: DUF2892 domain-containing protein [Lacisediminimonas sp.]|nr:DUF2892 domain-containing protein [Lacisediminimonas sp.]
MKLNMGSLDRGLRVAAGAGLLIATAVGAIGLWGLVGLVPLLTGLSGYCPLYSLVGMNTCPMKK